MRSIAYIASMDAAMRFEQKAIEEKKDQGHQLNGI